MPDVEERAGSRSSPEVTTALESGRAVVALESTVLAHGLPRPRNLEVATELESVVRARGAVPATVAVIDGVPRIGLSPEELIRVATDPRVSKLSTRDLPTAIAAGMTGATTVAATAFLAARAGIQVFATGGIGGVHRGSLPDISADIVELRRSSIIVVCAGAKAILDLPATREALETLGIPVFGWQTGTFPGFYYRDTGLPVDARVEDAPAVAAIWKAHAALGVGGAILVCVPVPSEAEIPAADVGTAIEAAIARAESEGVRGKEITPYLLRELGMATHGATLETNISLLRNNVAVAAAVAMELGR